MRFARLAACFDQLEEISSRNAMVILALYAVATASGKGAQGQKKGLLADILARCRPIEARHVAGIVLGRLRLGIGDPTVMDGLSYARVGTKEDRKNLERAYNLCSDLGLVARTYLEGGAEALAAIRVQVGKSVRPALCERVSSPAALIERLGRCAVEPKIDGFRCQIHNADDGRLRAYSRSLEDMSDMFPEIVGGLRGQADGHTVIVEGEAVGFDPDTLELHPFRVTVQRRRKYGIADVRETLPLKLLAFDLLYLDGNDLTPLPYRERRRSGPGAGEDLLGDALRFPRAVGFLRADRQAEDATTVEEVIGLYQKQGQRTVGGGSA